MKFNNKIYFQNLLGIWQKYNRKYKKVGYNFEFVKRLKKTKLVLEKNDSEENDYRVESFNEREEKAFGFLEIIFEIELTFIFSFK